MKKITEDLTFDEMSEVMSEILNGKTMMKKLQNSSKSYQTKARRMKNYVRCLQK